MINATLLESTTHRTRLWSNNVVILAALLAMPLAPSKGSGLQSLNDFLRHAKEHNFDNREARALALQRAHEASEAWARLFPSLSLQADNIRNQYLGAANIPTGEPAAGGILPTRQVIITPTNQWDASISATLPLVDLASWADIGAASANRQAQEARVEATELDVQKTVARTYYQFIGAIAVGRAARRTLAAAEDNARYIGTRTRAGLVLDLDLKRSLAEVERDRQAIEDADYSTITLRRSLETLTGLRVEDDSTSFSSDLLEDSLREESSLAEWMANLEKLPSVKAALHDQEAADYAASRAQDALYPSLSLQFTETATNAVGFGESPYHSVRLLASWKLDLSSSNSAKAQAAAAEATSARYDRARSAAADIVFNDWQAVRTQMAKSRAARSSLDASRAALSVARENYSSGKATFLEVVQAERDAFSAEVTDIQALADLASARAILRLSAGQSLVTP